MARYEKNVYRLPCYLFAFCVNILFPSNVNGKNVVYVMSNAGFN